MTDRKKLEKVINGLEDSLANNGCGFMDGIGELFAVSGEDLRNAIALLKAHEPRVMTLEEVKAMKRYTICAVEQRSKVLHTTFNAEYRGHLTIGGRDYIDFGLYADVSPFRRSESGYGKTWRCWTSRPTDKQREATPWN